MEVRIRRPYVDRERRPSVPVGESMTQQNFKEECDVNNILRRFERDGVVEHLARYQGQYADVSTALGFREAMQVVCDAREAFESLPSGLRKRFGNSPEAFLAFVEDPANEDEMRRLGLLNPVRDTSAQPEGEQPAPEEPAAAPEEPPA